MTAAEAVKAAGERAAELRVEQQQRTELVQLREAALEVERARFAAGRSYRDINGDARAVLIKCIFKLKGEKGFSKIQGKEQQLLYLDAQGDIGALLAGGVAVSEDSPETPPTAANASSSPDPVAATAALTSTDEEIVALLALMARRKAAATAVATATAASITPTVAPADATAARAVE